MLTLENALVLVLFLVPGYLAATFYNRNTPYADLSDLRFVIQIAVWGAVMQVLALPLSVPLVQVLRADPEFRQLDTHFWLLASGSLAVVMFAIPVWSGLVLGVISRRRRVQELLSAIGMGAENVPTAWDYAFRNSRDPAYLRVYLKGYADPIAGVLGRESLAGLSPHGHDLFLQSLVRFDENRNWRAVEGSAGVWISSEEIDFIELYAREGDIRATPSKPRATAAPGRDTQGWSPGSQSERSAATSATADA